MPSPTPSTAMVFAAGLGKRMRPITDATPKPLIKVAGRALIDHCLNRFAAAGVARAIVNVHWLADQIEAHLADRQSPRSSSPTSARACSTRAAPSNARRR